MSAFELQFRPLLLGQFILDTRRGRHARPRRPASYFGLLQFEYPSAKELRRGEEWWCFFVNFEEAYRVLPSASRHRLQSLYLDACWPVRTRSAPIVESDVGSKFWWLIIQWCNGWRRRRRILHCFHDPMHRLIGFCLQLLDQTVFPVQI